MTILAEKNHAHRALIQEHPAVGMGSPEFQKFVKAVIKAAGSSLRAVGRKIAEFFRYVGKKMDEAAEIDRRQQLAKEGRLDRHWDRLSML